MNYTIRGRVMRGDGYGRKIGFPTANLSRNGFVRFKNKPAFGVYAGFVVFNKKRYKAGIIIGPLDKNKLPKIEAHLVGFKKDIYGRNVTFEINKFLRKFKKFKRELDLIAQIKKDLKRC